MVVLGFVKVAMTFSIIPSLNHHSEKTYWTSVPQNWVGPRQLEINKGR